MRVLALDPGERVGWAVGSITGPEDGQVSLRIIDHGIAYLKDMALAVHRAVVLERKYDVVVYETFKLSARGAKTMLGSDLQTAQFVGMVRLCCWVAGIPCYPQGPAAMSSARRSLAAHPSGASVRARLDKLPKAHDDSHDGSALLHLWTHFFERYV